METVIATLEGLGSNHFIQTFEGIALCSGSQDKNKVS